MTLPLVWRRRAPLVVMCTVIGSALLGGVIYGYFVSWQPFVAFIVAIYSVAAHSERRRAIAGLAIAVAALVPGEVIHAVTHDESVDLGFLVVLGAAWAVGRTLRRWRVEAGELWHRADRLEREREQQARIAVAEERARIARELHDVVAHAVSVVVIQAQGAQAALEGEQPPVREALSSIESTGRQALVEMRRLLGVLRRGDEDLALAPQPSLRHLGALVEHVRDAGLPVELRVDGEATQLPPGVDVSAYRIVQEALTNALSTQARLTPASSCAMPATSSSSRSPTTAGGRGGTAAAATGSSGCASAWRWSAASSRAAARRRAASSSAPGSRSARRGDEHPRPARGRQGARAHGASA